MTIKTTTSIVASLFLLGFSGNVLALGDGTACDDETSATIGTHYEAADGGGTCSFDEDPLTSSTVVQLSDGVHITTSTDASSVIAVETAHEGGSKAFAGNTDGGSIQSSEVDNMSNYSIGGQINDDGTLVDNSGS